MRLDKFLCIQTSAARSEAKQILKAGRVCLNGSVEKRPECKIDENKDQITLDGKILSYRQFYYYLLHKPAGCITATKDGRDKTVMDLLLDAPGKDLSPVGRLDKDTEGLLLITNDGNLNHRLLSPKKHVPKTYYVEAAKELTDLDLCKLSEGLDIGDEKLTLPATACLCKNENHNPDSKAALKLTITEGRFHQVKRMLQALDNEVLYLRRLSMGPLVLTEDLLPGTYRELTEEELKELGIV